MKRAVRLVGVLAATALLVGGLAPSALAGRNVVKNVAYQLTFAGCVVPVTVTTTKVPSDAYATISLNYTDGTTWTNLQTASPVAVGTDDRSFAYTFSGPTLAGKAHMEITANVYKYDHNGAAVQIGTGKSPQFSTTDCTAGVP